MRVALCQINTTVGDLPGNTSRMLSWYRLARERGAELVVFPELALSGYPPRDLVELPDFRRGVDAHIGELVAGTGPAGLLFGTPLANPNAFGKSTLNGAVLAAQGRLLAQVYKKLLPVYDVFDEARNFEPHPAPAEPVAFGGIRWGIHICEDAWNESGFWPRRLYQRDPVTELARAGADVLLNLSSSPFHAQKGGLRRAMFASHSRTHGLPLLYTNLVGGNDELVFDGEAYVFDGKGILLASGYPFEEEILFVDVVENQVAPVVSWSPKSGDRPAAVHERLDNTEAVRRALVMGLGDYAAKCGFTTAVLGLSGGIDSALTAVLAVQALGAENVWGIALPSRYSSPESLTDALTLARTLGLRFQVLPIEEIFTASLRTLAPTFANLPPDTTEENLQARARGMLLTAISNKFGHLILSTGNKSELAVGYCTLYGDMVGGLAVISDVPKTMVFALAEHLNREREVIPRNTITKPPSAELRPNQRDEDSLPPYPLLDRIIQGYIEDGLGLDDLTAQGLPEDVVRRTVQMIWKAEYKRRQAAPGIKISPKAFGSGRRMPIAARWPLPQE